jgi:hypothetical protein
MTRFSLDAAIARVEKCERSKTGVWWAHCRGDREGRPEHAMIEVGEGLGGWR